MKVLNRVIEALKRLAVFKQKYVKIYLQKNGLKLKTLLKLWEFSPK